MTKLTAKPIIRGKCLLSSFCIIFILLISCLNITPASADETKSEKAADIGLIQPSDLQKNISSWIILDARPQNVWNKGHIKGSIPFSWEQYTRTDDKGIEYRIFPPAELSAKLGNLGIDENSSIVVYGDADSSWGGEGWAIWALSWLGHKGKIRLLDGGIQGWTNQKLETVQGDSQPKRPELKYQYKTRESLIVSTEKLKTEKSALTIIDNRSAFEWMKGHISDAKRIEWTNLYKGPERKPLQPGEYKKLLSSNGIDASKPVVFYCTGGIRSGYAWLVHQLSGLPSAMNYEEGMVAWDKE